MAEKQFIVKKKKVFPKVEQKTEPQAEEVQESVQEQQEDSGEFSFDDYLNRLKAKVEKSSLNIDEEPFKDRFIFGKYSQSTFASVLRDDPKYIIFLFSKKMGEKIEMDKARLKSYVEERATRTK